MDANVGDIINFMEKLAPSNLAESWDNTGLAVGDSSAKVKKILIALDAIEPVIDEAIEIGANMIVTHHPMLLFKKINSITKNDALGRKIYKLIENKISAFSAHTNLDIVNGGINDVLANRIGLKDVEILEETYSEELKKIVIYTPSTHTKIIMNTICNLGAGHIGNYKDCTFQTLGKSTFMPLDGTNPFIGQSNILEMVEETKIETIAPKTLVNKIINGVKKVHPYEEMAYDIYPVEQKGYTQGIGRIGVLEKSMSLKDFAKLLKEKLNLNEVIHIVGNPNKEISRVALCGGSASDLASLAKLKGADIYITGDFKFHDAQNALEMDLAIADVTHYAGEVIILPVLQELLQKEALKNSWNIEIVISKIDGQTFWTL